MARPLERRLARLDGFAIALGGVIGVGVFRATGVALRGTDDFAAATAIWVFAGVVCLAGSLLYAELSARVPEAGGPYAYVRTAFGRPAGFAYGWMYGGVAIPVRLASTATVIGEVSGKWLDIPPRWIGGVVLVALVGLNLLGVRAGAIAQRVFTTGKLITAALVIGGAAILAATSSSQGGTALAPVSLATAIGAVWYTYLGWQDAVLLAEELRDPRRDLPVVLVGTVATVVVIYTGIHVAVYAGLHGDAAASAELPALEVATRLLGAFGAALITVLMLSSMVGGAAEALMVRPRILMALARDRLGPAPLALVGRAGAPYGAMLAQASIALALLATGSFVELLPLLLFAQGFLGVLESASYFRIVANRQKGDPVSRFHPIAPLAFVAANASVCILAAIDDPLRAAIAVGALLTLAGIYSVTRSRSTIGPSEP